MGAENPVTSCDLHVLVHEVAEPVPAQRVVRRVGAWGSVTGGLVLMRELIAPLSALPSSTNRPHMSTTAAALPARMGYVPL